jgi:4,5-DOPA dioxygenase extradiol
MTTEDPGRQGSDARGPAYDPALMPALFIGHGSPAGLASASTDAQALLRGYAMGSLSMTCYGVGLHGMACKDGENAARLPEGVPPDQTNI